MKQPTIEELELEYAKQVAYEQRQADLQLVELERPSEDEDQLNLFANLFEIEL